MATTAKKEVKAPAARKTAAKKSTSKVADTKPVTNETAVKETAKFSAPESAAKKRRDPDELIECISQFPGSLILVGRKTMNVYQWDEPGEVQEVMYQDLLPELLNKNSSYIYDPLFVINDESIIEERKGLKELYEKILPPHQIVNVLKNGTTAEVKKTISLLPDSMRSNVKTIASSLIMNGELERMSIIKVLDEILGTQLTDQLAMI